MGKTKTRALILDYGGVISQPQNPENVNNLLTSLGKERNDFHRVYKSLRPQYDDGQLSGAEYWTSILQHYGLQPDSGLIARLIREDIQSWTHINSSMIQFIQDCKSRVYRLAIISNMTRDSLAFIREHFQWLDLFDILTFSCDVGKNKPDREIYEACLARLGTHPAECLFVDDSLENVQGAMQVGMPTIQFKTFAEFAREVDERFCLTQ
jgi:putative hydrolase of the HAD superfamily